MLDEHATPNGTALATAEEAAPVFEPFDLRRPRLIEPVAITLDKERHLRLPFWALRKFEQTTHLSPWDHEKVWAWPMHVDVMLALLWVALLDEDPTLTLEQVERFDGLELANTHYIYGKLNDCWGRNQPSADAAESAPNGQAAADPNPSRPNRPTG